MDVSAVSLVCGIDLSTKRIDVAALTYDDPIRLWIASREVDQADKGAERARHAGHAARDCIIEIQRQADRDVTSVAIEVPSGHHVHPSLGHVYGAICALVPGRIPITGLAPSAWRKTIKAKKPNDKASGHEAVVLWLWPPVLVSPIQQPRFYDEHELDAIGIALAWRTRQWEATTC